MRVSCVMPTGDRHAFVEGAITCFLGQTFNDAELVILDDGIFPCSARVPAHPRIRYVYVEPPSRKRHATGTKRNMVNALAQGDVIINWDDDDWSHHERVGRQLADLEDSKKQVTGYHSLLYYRLADGKGFKYNEPAFRPNAAGSSQCYWKSYWKTHPYLERNIAEDYLFAVMARKEGQLASEDGTQMLVARVHDRNTCAPKFGSKHFPEVPLSDFPVTFRNTLACG